MNYVFITLLLLIIFFTIIIIITDDVKKSILSTCFISYISVLYYISVRAPDVAITEVAVGSLMTTLVLMFGAQFENRYINKNTNNKKKELWFIIPLFVTFFIVISLTILFVMPEFGKIQNSIHNDVYDAYCNEVHNKFGFNNIVTSILAGYRGFDTLCETLVIFISCISVFLIIDNNKYEKK